MGEGVGIATEGNQQLGRVSYSVDLQRIIILHRNAPNTNPTPPEYWERIHNLVSDFIWQGERPKIQISILFQPTNAGGLGLPDLKLYY